jgi:hypothetical protein
MFTGDMGHCWVMWKRYWPEPGVLAHEITLKAEHSPGGLYQDVSLMRPDQMAELVAQNLKPIDILAGTVLVQRNRMRYFGSFNCVTAVKAVLNLDAPWCLTPSQLHRRLVVMGWSSTLEDGTCRQ